MNKPKVTKKKWEENVRQAMTLLPNYQKSRWIICDLALEVCDYTIGGRRTDSQLTLSNFAEEIGVERKTLYQWVRVKKLVYDKLPKTVRDNPKKHKYNYRDLETVALTVKPTSSIKEVQNNFNKRTRLNPFVKKWEKYAGNLNAIIYNAQRWELMKDVDQDTLNKLIEKSNLVSSLLTKELELRKKFSGNRQIAKRLNLKEELAKRIGAA